MNQKTSSLSRISKKEIAGSILLIAICVLPFFTFAKDRKIYVDDNASGNEDGSSKHPYKTIGKALDKADNNTTVFVRSGKYEENIELSKGVKLSGSDKNDVVIEGDDNEEIVSMKDKTEISDVTIRGGKEGIEVQEGAKATITNCIIKDNKKSGISIEKAGVNGENQVYIGKNKITKNGKNGIFSEKRKLSIEDNDILNNNGDGIGIMPGSKAWIKGNRIKDNDGSGMRINIDGSDIWTKSNTYRENKREGIEIDSFGGAGRIDINKSKFWGNSRWAIAKIQKSGSTANWKGVTIQGNNEFVETKIGNVSPIIRVN